MSKKAKRQRVLLEVTAPVDGPNPVDFDWGSVGPLRTSHQDVKIIDHTDIQYVDAPEYWSTHEH